jgi:hypothetical protein
MKFRPAASLPLLAAVGLLLGAAAAACWPPGCPVREWTGLKCPGCGSGRAMAALLRGDPRGAIYWNAMLLPLVAILAMSGFYQAWTWRGWLGLAAGILGFGVVRNLPFYLLY